jgi:GT2 family glycosyltransferase
VARKIKHISKILYHWRAIPGSTALEMSEKKYVLEAGVKALSDRVARKGCKGTVKISLFPGCFNILYEIVRNPLISIIIPSAGKKSVIRGTNIDLLANCIESIVHKSTYRNYEIIVVDNDDLEKSTIERISNHVKHSIHFKKPFNVASKMNLGAQYASGDYLLFLNDDTEVISHDWLEGLLGLAQWEAIGVVGAKLLFEDGTIQHAGVAFTDDGLPDHVFRSYPGNLPGHFYNVCGNRNYLAVTGACLLTKKDVFHKVSGFNEDFAINYNDIDYCLKVHDAGFRIVYTPHAVLYHYESRSRERTVSQQEIDLFLDLWFKKTKRDPYYHPHLDCRPPNFKINIR